MEHSHRFFSNEKCMFFPCHPNMEGEYNCLFCYCPLYFLGEECGGDYRWAVHENIKIKICSDCTLPHLPENYDLITGKLTEEAISAVFFADKG